jgi:hypothetical protein
MVSKGILLALLLGACCGLAVAWAMSGPADETATGIEDPEGQKAANPDLRRSPEPDPDAVRNVPGEATLTGGSRAADRYGEAVQKNEALRARVKELEERVADLAPKAVDPQAFRFGLPEKVASFDSADWPTLADHMLELRDLITAVRDEFLRIGRPTAATMTRVQKHNMPLARFALALGPEIGEDNANSAYTHPAVIANLIRSSLQHAGDPLTRDQELAIKVLGDAWERDLTRGVVPPGSPELGGLVAKVDAKLRFLADVKAVLSSSQRSALFNPETEGRLHLDLLSPALDYVHRFPVETRGRADMETKLLEQLFEHAGVEVENLTPYAWVAREWVDEMPGVLTPIARLSQELAFPHVDAIQQHAQAQVRAVARILGMGRLEAENAEKVRALTWLLDPYVLLVPQAPAAPPSDGSGR